jgi:hypothetical protein
MDQPDKAQKERIQRGVAHCKRQHAAVLRVVESVVEGTNGVRKQGGFRLVQVGASQGLSRCSSCFHSSFLVLFCSGPVLG